MPALQYRSRLACWGMHRPGVGSWLIKKIIKISCNPTALNWVVCHSYCLPILYLAVCRRRGKILLGTPSFLNANKNKRKAIPPAATAFSNYCASTPWMLV